MQETRPLERMPTHVPGLDVVLGGGFLRGGVYLVMGGTGVGKTVLSAQIAFSHAARGGKALYVTVLAESHGRMLAQLREMAFFDEEAIATRISFLGGYTVLEEHKLEGLLELLRTEVRRWQATLLVIDGVTLTGGIAEGQLAVKKFVYELKTFIELAGCTCLMLTAAEDAQSSYQPRTMVDGILELNFTHAGLLTARVLEMVKLRGSRHLLGKHLFEISGAGITVYPRIEAVYGRSRERDEQRRRMVMGVPVLDEMLGGGVPSGTLTLVLGPPGSGKTLLGLEFLGAGAARGEESHYLGFQEAPARLVATSDAAGLRLRDLARGNAVAIEWIPPLEQYADAISERLLAAVRDRKIRRLVIDGVGGIEMAMFHKERLPQIFTALANELGRLGVTTLVTADAAQDGEQEGRFGSGRMSATADNVVVLRNVRRRAQYHRLLGIAKMREGEYDTAIREFWISAEGFRVDSSSAGAETVFAPYAADAAQGKRPAAARKGRRGRP